MTIISLDKEYQNERHLSNIHKPENVTEGLVEGVKGFGKGIVGGIKGNSLFNLKLTFSFFKGLVDQPLKGIKKDGAKGFAKGIGKGLIG